MSAKAVSAALFDSRLWRALDAVRAVVGTNHVPVRDDPFEFGDGLWSGAEHAYRRYSDKVKDAVDPNGILSADKQAIWPASYRDGGALEDR